MGGGVTTNGPTGTPMYWTIPIGAVLGVLVVLAFERLTKQMTRSRAREALSDDNTRLALEVEASLAAAVDGPRNVFEFWSGGLLLSRRSMLSREHLARSYEILAIVNALMLSVCVTFYTADDPDTLFGLVCCIANCALWMATLSSAFFYVVVNSCDSDDELELLVELIGTLFFRAPMLLFVWGSLLLFLEFVLYFKIHVDAGFNCSMCLASCFILVPLFMHCMHKMGWAATVVHAESASRRRRAAERPCAPVELKGAFLDYAASKPVLSLDKGELRKFAEDRLGLLTTTAQHAFLDKLFDRYVDARLDDLTSDAAFLDKLFDRYVDARPDDLASDAATPRKPSSLDEEDEDEYLSQTIDLEKSAKEYSSSFSVSKNKNRKIPNSRKKRKDSS